MRKRHFVKVLLLAPLFSGCAEFPDGFIPPSDSYKPPSVAAPPSAPPSSPATPAGNGKRPASATLGTPAPIADEAVLIYQPASTDTGAPIDILKKPAATDH